MKRKKIKVIVLLPIFLTLLLFSLIVTSSMAETFNFKFATGAPETASKTNDEVKQWAKNIEKATNGRLKIEIYWGGALGKATDLFKMLDSGLAQMGNEGFNRFPGKYPITTVMTLPFVSTSPAAIGTLMNSLYYDGLLKEYNDTKLLLFKPSDPFMLFTKKPVTSLEELKGLKIRANAQGMVSMLKLMGATPVSIAPNELYPALERGIVDGVITSFGFFLPMKFDEVCKNVLVEPIGGTMTLMLASWKAYNKLPADIQHILDTESRRLFWTAVYHESERHINDYLIPAKKRGVTLNYLTEQERQRWIDVTKPLINEWVEKMDADGLPGTEAINRAKIISQMK